MVRKQRSTNVITTNLNGAISIGATSMAVNSVAGMPTEGDFYLLVNDETVLVTAIASLTLTIIRGQEGSTAASQVDNTLVTGIATKGDFENRIKDLGQIKTLPYGRVQQEDGTILTATDFALRNTGTGTAVEDGNDGIITFRAKDMASNQATGAIRTFTSANDHQITAHIGCPAMDGTSPDLLQFLSRQATGGSLHGLTLRPNVKVATQQRTSFTATTSDDVSHGAGSRLDFWVRLKILWDVSGSTDNLVWSYSWDGVHWWEMHTHALVSDSCEVGIWLTNQTGTIANMRAHIFSWYEEAI